MRIRDGSFYLTLNLKSTKMSFFKNWITMRAGCQRWNFWSCNNDTNCNSNRSYISIRGKPSRELMQNTNLESKLSRETLSSRINSHWLTSSINLKEYMGCLFMLMMEPKDSVMAWTANICNLHLNLFKFPLTRQI